MLGSRDADKGQMRFLNILKCLYRLPEDRANLRDSLNDVHARLDALEAYATAVTQDRLEPVEAAVWTIDETLVSANHELTAALELAAARLSALEQYVSALTEDRVEPLEAQLQTLREALGRYAAGNRAGVIANQTRSPAPEVPYMMSAIPRSATSGQRNNWFSTSHRMTVFNF